MRDETGEIISRKYSHQQKLCLSSWRVLRRWCFSLNLTAQLLAQLIAAAYKFN